MSQPAIFVASMAALEKLKALEGADAVNRADVACGLSLGEYTALAYAGAMSFEDGVRLVKLRGESMQAAADAKPSGMVSVIGLDAGKVGCFFPLFLWGGRREGNLHVGQKFRQVRCPTVCDISIEQHSTHENTINGGRGGLTLICEAVGGCMQSGEVDGGERDSISRSKATPITHTHACTHAMTPPPPPTHPPTHTTHPQVAELCEAATKEVGAEKGVRIANYLCNGNYAISGGLEGCEAVEKLAKSFKARCACV